MSEKSTALVQINAARRALAAATSIKDVKDVRDKAEAIRNYLRQQEGCFEAQNSAAELKLRAERRLGELLKGIVVPRGNHNQGTRGSTPSLPDGVTKNDSCRWQKVLSIKEDRFETHLGELKESRQEITTASFLKLASKIQAEHRRQSRRSKLLEENNEQEEDDSVSNKKKRGKKPWEIIVGDCRESHDIQSGSARLVFADPPYNIGIDYGEGCEADRMDEEAYLKFCEGWVAISRERLTEDGSLWVLISDEYAAEMGCLLKRQGLTIRNWIKWYETFGVNCSDKFNRTSRHLFYCVKNPKEFIFNREAVTRTSDRQTKYKDSRANPDGKIWDDVWQIPRLTGTAKERLPDFPTQLPLALLTPIILCASDPGDLVIDPFSGSGTTGAVCIATKRRYIGIEKSKEFSTLAIARLKGIKP